MECLIFNLIKKDVEKYADLLKKFCKEISTSENSVEYSTNVDYLDNPPNKEFHTMLVTSAFCMDTRTL